MAFCSIHSPMVLTHTVRDTTLPALCHFARVQHVVTSCRFSSCLRRQCNAYARRPACPSSRIWRAYPYHSFVIAASSIVLIRAHTLPFIVRVGRCSSQDRPAHVSRLVLELLLRRYFLAAEFTRDRPFRRIRRGLIFLSPE